MKTFALTLVLIPAVAQASTLPVLTVEPPDPSNYKQLEFTGFDFIGPTLTVAHSTVTIEPNYGVAVGTLTAGAANYWLGSLDGNVDLFFEPPGFSLRQVYTDGLPLPSITDPAWAAIYAAPHVTFEATDFEWQYTSTMAGNLVIDVTGSSSGGSNSLTYTTPFTSNVPEPNPVVMTIMALFVLYLRSKGNEANHTTTY